jgi:hypothetical protein
MKPIRILLLLVMIASLIFACTAPASVTPVSTPLPSATPIKPTRTPLLPPTLTPTATFTLEPEGLKPGDSIGDMVLQQAPGENLTQALLWNYCDPSVGDEQGNPAYKQCDVPQFPYLFIGNGMGGIYGEELEEAWNSLRWELSIDDLVVDLAAFGPIDLSEAGFRLWNIGIDMPSKGKHILRYEIFPAYTFMKSY